MLACVDTCAGVLLGFCTAGLSGGVSRPRRSVPLVSVNSPGVRRAPVAMEHGAACLRAADRLCLHVACTTVRRGQPASFVVVPPTAVCLCHVTWTTRSQTVVQVALSAASVLSRDPARVTSRPLAAALSPPTNNSLVC